MMADGEFELGSSGSATGVFSTTLRPPPVLMLLVLVTMPVQNHRSLDRNYVQ